MKRGPGRDSRRERSGRDAARTSALTSPSDRLKAGFVLLVGLSGGTMALQGGASLTAVGVTVVVGLVAGSALLWYLLWLLDYSR